MTADHELVPMFDVVDLSVERYRVLDRKVDAAEGDGILARWEFGRELLAERVGKKLPPGRLAEVAQLIGKSETEVSYRVRFAEKYPDMEVFRNAIAEYRSWYGIVNKALGTAHVANNSGENEWYTPRELLDAARTVMGGIDLDPASSEAAQATVQSGAFFTASDDGLSRDWWGRVWLNPPYSSDLVGRFIDKLIAERAFGRVPQAVVLVNNATETVWGQRLLGASSAVCFLRGRVRYLTAAGVPAHTPLQGQMVALLQDAAAVDSFHSTFGRLGVVL